ncbi:hypothetical protein P3T21_002099 [Paraburkholderia sp. GAS334]
MESASERVYVVDDDRRVREEKNASGFICLAGQAGKQTATRNIVGDNIRCLTLASILCWAR